MTRKSTVFNYGDYEKVVRQNEMLKEELTRLRKMIPGQTVDGDLISRQDAIEAIATVTMSIHLSNVLCDKLLALPSADRPTGKWEIKTETDEYGLKRPKLVCSKCEKEPAAWDLTELFEFCPNCGAKMVREDGEEE